MAEEPIPEMAHNAAIVSTRQATRPTTDTNALVQMIVGFIGTIAILAAVAPLKDSSNPGLTYVWGILWDRGPVQYAELFMAFMVAALVFMKVRVIRAQISVIADAPIPPNLDLTDDDRISDLRRDLNGRNDFSWSILLNRVDRILGLWLGSKDIIRVASWTGSESDRDMSGSDSSYSIARVLIWAIPILGFIGTVVGLGGAVSGFTEFLGGAAELSTIKDAIGNVTSKLGVAFDTTLLALILSVFLMFPLSWIQRKEENFFIEVDNYLDDMLISRFPSTEQQPIVIENLEDAIEAAFRRYIPDPDRYDEVFTRSIEKAAHTVEEHFTSLASSYESTLKDMSDRLSVSMAKAGDAVNEALQNTLTDLQSQESSLIETRKQLAADEREKLVGMLNDVQTTSAKIAVEYKRSAEALQNTTKESAATSLEAAKSLADKLAEISKMARSIEDLLHIQKSLDTSLAGISSANEFTQMLQNLREHLAATDDFCSRMSKPRVITLREEIG